MISEYGKEKVKILRRWEKIELKMADFKNHRQFTLRCLSSNIIPVSVQLKSNIKTPKGRYIIRKAEKALLNERVRSINNTINMFKWQINTCIEELGKLIRKEDMEKCYSFIESIRETRHRKTQKRHLEKFKRLCHRNTGGRSNLSHSGTLSGIGTGGRSNQNTEMASLTQQNNNTPDSISYNNNNNNSNNNSNNKWVKNLSRRPLTKAQENILSHGPNYAIVTREPPIGEYVAQIERVCQSLTQGEGEELRAEVKAIMKRTKAPKSNISKEEARAIKELKKDQDRMVLTADKGVSMVVMDREEYEKISEDLLNQSTYRVLPSDPTSKQKNKLIAILKNIKSEGGINDNIYRKLYPTGASTPKYYGLPKVHKKNVPLRPIISSRGAATYESAKELARILKPLVGKSPHHVHNTQDFIHSIKDIKIQDHQCMMSYDVHSLFTSIPIDPAITIIRRQLEQDKDLQQRTNMTVNHICCLLEFCLKNTFFQYKGRYYEQTEGAAMGSPISPIVANLFMEDLEVQAIMTSPSPPVLWKRYVDDTFTIIHKQDKDAFLEHLNNIHPNIKFTSEETRPDGAIPFLDILITPKDDGSLQTSVYRKPTHTDLYLQWDSHHTIPSKYSVVGTLYHRAKTICSNQEMLLKEEQHLFQALKKCKYPTWALNRVKLRCQNPSNKSKNNNQKKQNNQTRRNLYMVVPYYKGLNESIKRSCSRFGVQVHFKGGLTIKDLLMAPKDKDHILKKSGVIYKYTCDKVECDEEYIGESARLFAERFK